jgi:hypothetical protein
MWIDTEKGRNHQIINLALASAIEVTPVMVDVYGGEIKKETYAVVAKIGKETYRLGAWITPEGAVVHLRALLSRLQGGHEEGDILEPLLTCTLDRLDEVAVRLQQTDGESWAVGEVVLRYVKQRRNMRL